MSYEKEKAATFAMTPAEYRTHKEALAKTGDDYFRNGPRKQAPTESIEAQESTAQSEAPVNASGNLSSTQKMPPPTNDGFLTVEGMAPQEYKRQRDAYLKRVRPHPRAF